MSILDLTTGALSLDDGTVLPANVSLDHLGFLQFHFLRTLDLHEGWRVFTSDPRLWGGHHTWLSFWVQDGVAHKVTLAFQDGQETEPREQQRRYHAFLEQHLGTPSEVRFDGAIVIYRYGWGEVQSMYDPRNGGSTMTISWSPTEKQPFIQRSA